jgi:hypothetical protein
MPIFVEKCLCLEDDDRKSEHAGDTFPTDNVVFEIPVKITLNAKFKRDFLTKLDIV